MTLFINDCINGQKEVVKLDGKKIGEFKLMSQIIHCFVQFFLGKIRPYSHTSSSLSIFTHYRGSNNQAVLALFRSVFLMCGSWRTSRHQLKLWNYPQLLLLKVASRIWAPIFSCRTYDTKTTMAFRFSSPRESRLLTHMLSLSPPRKSFQNFRHHKVKTWHYCRHS